MKKIILFLFFVLLLSSVATAAINLTKDLTHYYSLINDTGTAKDDVGILNGALNGHAHFNSTDCKIDNCLAFDGVSDNADFPSPFVTAVGGFTLSMWIKSNDWDNVNRQTFITNRRDTSASGFILRADERALQVSVQSVAIINVSDAIVGTGYKHIVYVYNLTSGTEKHKLYSDNVKQTLDAADLTPVILTSPSYNEIEWASVALSLEELDGFMDEIAIYDRVLNESEIAALWNNGFAFNPLTGASSQPTLELETSLINNTQNYNLPTLNFTYNGTFVGATTDLANCTFTQQSVTNQTIEVNLSLNNQYNISLGGVENFYNISFVCSNFETSADSGVYYYNVDVVVPIIESDFVNNTEFNFSDSLTFYVNFTDQNLFAYNISFINLSNNLVTENIFADNLSVTFAENSSTRTLNSHGNFSILVTAWDSHTKKEIPDYKIDRISDGIKFDNQIELYGVNVKNIQTRKKKDRYEFELNFHKQETWTTIFLESNSNLYYLEDSEYKGHFVDLKNKKWIDFESKQYDDIKIRKHSNRKYQIDIRAKNKKSVTFNSIGDLNEENKQWFYNVNPQVIVPTNVTAINLTGLENKLGDVSDSISMGAIFFFIGILIFAGIVSRFYILWSISGLGFGLIALRMGESFVQFGQLFQKVAMFGFLFLAFAFFILGIFIQILVIRTQRKTRADDFYNIDY